MSFFNKDEVECVVKYVRLVLDSNIVEESDIGIISPYKLQVSFINNLKNFCNNLN